VVSALVGSRIENRAASLREAGLPVGLVKALLGVEKDGPPDEARDEAGRWTAEDTGRAADAQLGGYSESNDPNGWLKPATGELLQNDGRMHIEHAHDLGFGNGSEMMEKGYVRVTSTRNLASGSPRPGFGLHFQNGNPDALKAAREFVERYQGGSRYTFDVVELGTGKEWVYQAPAYKDAVAFLDGKKRGKLVDRLKSVPAEDLGSNRSPDRRKPRMYPDVGEDMGFNDTYDALAKVAKAEGKSTVAIDFDGTCTVDADGAENPKMRKLVRALFDRDVDVVIFTARDADDVEAWLEDKGWPALEVTNVKSPDFRVMLDDRAVNFNPSVLASGSDVAGYLAGFKAWWEKADSGPVSKSLVRREVGRVVERRAFAPPGHAPVRHGVLSVLSVARCQRRGRNRRREPRR
jgi:hypothetical protein